MSDNKLVYMRQVTEVYILISLLFFKSWHWSLSIYLLTHLSLPLGCVGSSNEHYGMKNLFWYLLKGIHVLLVLQIGYVFSSRWFGYFIFSGVFLSILSEVRTRSFVLKFHTLFNSNWHGGGEAPRPLYTYCLITANQLNLCLWIFLTFCNLIWGLFFTFWPQ